MQMLGISGEEDLGIRWYLVGGNNAFSPHGLEASPDDAFVRVVADERSSTLRLSPQVRIRQHTSAYVSIRQHTYAPMRRSSTSATAKKRRKKTAPTRCQRQLRL